MNEMTYKDSLDNLERNFNEKVVEFTASFNQIFFFFFFFFFFLRDFIFKKTLFEKLQYLKQEQ